MTPSEKVNSSRQVQLLAVILILSLGLNGILFLKRTEVFPAKKVLLEENKKLDQKLSSARNELYKYRGISEQIDKVIQDANKSIEQSEKQIAALRRDRKQLVQKNDELIMQLDSLQESYLTVIDSLLVEQDNSNILNNKIESLEEIISDLNRKIGIAGWLVSDNLKVIPMKNSLTGKMQQTALARKVSQIDVCLDLLQNRTTSPGKKDIFLVITTPDGTILSEEGRDPGTFRHPEYKKDAHFSARTSVDYRNEKTNVCIRLKTSQELQNGLYVVEVFTSENKLTLQTFSLK